MLGDSILSSAIPTRGCQPWWFVERCPMMVAPENALGLRSRCAHHCQCHAMCRRRYRRWLRMRRLWHAAALWRAFLHSSRLPPPVPVKERRDGECQTKEGGGSELRVTICMVLDKRPGSPHTSIRRAGCTAQNSSSMVDQGANVALASIPLTRKTLDWFGCCSAELLRKLHH